MDKPSHRLSPDPSLDAVFAVLADPTRRAMLARLVEGEASVAQLREPFAMSQSVVSKHLKVLERAGLVEHRAADTRRPARLRTHPLAAANRWLEDYRALWQARFDQLDVLLHQLADEASQTQND
ncbi:MAG: DNA-binding transcriptional ArsR family regulator [Bradymonadia bacterium]|jgi:DNA-binding transcriptional ArsR family regulator